MAERKQQPTTEGETKVLVYKMKCTSRPQIQTQENKKTNVNVIDIIQTCYSIVFFDNIGARSHIVK